MRLQEKLCKYFGVDTKNLIDVTINIKPEAVTLNATYQTYLDTIDDFEKEEKYFELKEIVTYSDSEPFSEFMDLKDRQIERIKRYGNGDFTIRDDEPSPANNWNWVSKVKPI